MNAKLFSTLLVLVFSALTLRAGEPVAVSSTAKDVTIYKSGAQIVRTANVDVPAGRTELVFKALSPQIHENTVQVKVSDGLTIMGLSFRVNYMEELSKQAEIRVLEQKITDLTDRIARLRTEQSVYKQEESLLKSNQVQIIGVQNNPLKTQDLHELADFLRSRLTEVLGKQYELELQIKQLEKEYADVQRQLNVLNAQRANPSGEIYLTLNAERAVKGNFTLVYFIGQAGWEPSYDLRVKDVESPVNLVQKANLFQQSGEIWKDVKLHLSTGNPTEGNNMPALIPWRLRYVSPYARAQSQQLGGRYEQVGGALYGEVRGRVLETSGEALIGATIALKGTALGAVTDMDGNFVLKIPNNGIIVVSYVGYSSMEIPVSVNGQNLRIYLEPGMALAEVVVSAYGAASEDRKKEDAVDEGEPPVTIVQLPTTYLYDIDLPITLESDAKRQTVDIKTYELPAGYRYYCAPKLEAAAFLSAQVTGWESLGLLSGEANLFFEGTYLGKSWLEFAGTKDTMQFSLGRDRNISVSRTKLKEFSRRQFFSGKKQDSRSFEIAVKNKKTQPITIVVEDQIPVSTNKGVNIERTEGAGAACDETFGKLSWTLKLAPSEDRKMRFGYTVRYPKERIIVLE